MKTALKTLLIVIIAGLLVACTKGPDELQVQQVVEQRLSEAFETKTLSLTSLRRMGSTPLSATQTGQPRQVVYYNASFKLERDYNFSDWNSLGFASFSNLMGATRLGVKGVTQGGNLKGDIIFVHGTVNFIFDDERWTPVLFAPEEAGVKKDDLAARPEAMQQYYLAEIEKIISQKSDDPTQQAEILQDELKKTYTSMRLRMGRLGRALIIAGGVEKGEYAKVVEILVESLQKQGVAALALTTEGSIENLNLLREGKADLALVQNDLARLSSLGTGVFKTTGPDYSLRTVASLFPEALHVIVNKNSAITVLEDLRGKRIELGKPNSGSKINSLSLLRAAGISLSELAAVHEDGLKEGLVKLASGKIDALIATINAPARVLQVSAVNKDLRFIPLSEHVINKLITESDGFIRFQLSPYTYPKQRKKVDTVAVTGMLVGPETLEASNVKLVLKELFENIDFASIGSSAGSHISSATASEAITLPMHEAAIDYFNLKSNTENDSKVLLR